MTLKYALVYVGVSGFVSKAALGRGSSLLLSTVFVFVVVWLLGALRSLFGTLGASAHPQAV